MRALPLYLLTVAVTAWPVNLAADPISFLDERSISASALFQIGGNQVVDDRQDLFFDAATSASAAVMSAEGHLAAASPTLSSSLSDIHHLVASGSGSASATLPLTNQTGRAEAGGSQIFSVLFLLETPHAFDFSGTFAGSDSGSEFHDRQWTASLLATSSTAESFVFHHERLGASGTDRVMEKGLLLPSEYVLDIRQSVFTELHQPGSTDALHEEFSFTFDLTPTPEPASLVLLGSGLLGLVGIRRRRQMH